MVPKSGECGGGVPKHGECGSGVAKRGDCGGGVPNSGAQVSLVVEYLIVVPR